MNLNLWIGRIYNFLYNDVVTHIPSHCIRKNFLKLTSKNISSTSKILMHSKIYNPWNLILGQRSIINQYCILDCRKYKIIIGDDVDIGSHAQIWTLGHNPDCNKHSLLGGNVIIENHVWVATRVTILPKVRLSKGSVVGAGSVVTKTTNSNEIVAGNPARFLRKRINNCTYELHFKVLLE